MPAHADIDIRMKENYENRYRIKLTRRIPVIVRIDGRAFHTFTRGFERPFDEIMITTMQDTMKYLCENIMGCQIGYCQSDEISLLLVDYQNFTSQPFFDYNIQKIDSICASMATLEFNRKFYRYVEDFKNMHDFRDDWSSELSDRYSAYNKALNSGAMFDARCFNVPREEVTNYFYSRQIDASRNSVEMVGRSYFSHKELHQKNGSMIQDMLHEKYGVNWNDLPTAQKRGACCIKENYYIQDGEECGDPVPRSRWIIDYNIPQFKGKDREYIDKYVDIDKE